MEDSNKEITSLKKEIAYYRRQLDEAAGNNLKLDHENSCLRHEMIQKKQGFKLLSELSQSLGAFNQVQTILEITAKAINSGLGMDKTVVLTPTGASGEYAPSFWLGYANGADKGIAEKRFKIPPDVATGRVSILAHGQAEKTELIEFLRSELQIPFFLATAIAEERGTIGIIVSGRMIETGALYPPLDQGDVDTFQAITGMISASIKNMRVSVLEETDRVKTEFFANISHEFRTPITLTLGPLEAMVNKRYGDLPEEVVHQAQLMLRNQKRLLNLINQILDLAKLEAGAMNLQAGRVKNVNGFVGIRCEQVKALAEKRGLKINAELKIPSGTETYFDAEKMDKVIFNLLSNAIKFTKKGSVDVSAKVNGPRIEIAVKDSGIGIREDQIKHIFDRFKQADGSSSREFAGTGIGLSLVKEIVELHGGEIVVTSEYGKGTCFTVAIPTGKGHLPPESIGEDIDEEDLQPSAAAEGMDVREGRASEQERGIADHLNATALSAHFDGKTILYADDNKDLRQFVSGVLATRFRVLLAVDGEHALEIAKRQPVDLILSDMMMPVMTGSELLKAVKADPTLRAIPFVILTAKTGVETKIKGLEGGAEDYLNKPFSSEELLARVTNLIKLREYQLRLNKELRAARSIQMSLMPANRVDFTGGRLEILYLPSEELSGDFVDYIALEKRVFFYVADVTSHGTAAAQVTYMVKGIFREAWGILGPNATLAEILHRVGEQYCALKLDYGVGIQAMLFDPVKRELACVASNAPPPVWFSGAEEKTIDVRPGPLLDAMLWSPTEKFAETKVSLKKGDRIFVFTDGCFEFEAGEDGNDQFGYRKLSKLLSSVPNAGWQDSVLENLKVASPNRPFPDDITIVRLQI